MRKRNKEYDRKYRALHIEEHRQEAAKYRQAHPERYKAIARKSYAKNKGKIKERRLANKDNIRQQSKVYRDKNKDKLKAKRLANKEAKRLYDQRYREENRERIYLRNRLRYEEQKEKYNTRARQRLVNNPEIRQARLLKSTQWASANAAHLKTYRASRKQRERELWLRNYNLTQNEYDAILASQNGRCAICGSTSPGKNKKHFAVDHDHECVERIKARGLLCIKCNTAIGGLYDNAKNCIVAIEYLNNESEFQWSEHSRQKRNYIYRELLDRQSGTCAICKKRPNGMRFFIDHNHSTLKVRGVLCPGCNMGIGNLHEDPTRLKSAALYLLKSAR